MVNLEFENTDLKGRINNLNSKQQTLQEQIDSTYKQFHETLDPILNAFDMITGDPEGYANMEKDSGKDA